MVIIAVRVIMDVVVVIAVMVIMDVVVVMVDSIEIHIISVRNDGRCIFAQDNANIVHVVAERPDALTRQSQGTVRIEI